MESSRYGTELVVDREDGLRRVLHCRCSFFIIGLYSRCAFFFFFQAEDGMRYHCVTGVQTCALPISTSRSARRATISTADERFGEEVRARPPSPVEIVARRAERDVDEAALGVERHRRPRVRVTGGSGRAPRRERGYSSGGRR